MTSKYLGFTGSQKGYNLKQRDVLADLFSTALFRDGILWMRNGDCLGSDCQAGQRWRSLGGLIHGHPPLDIRKRAFLPFDSWNPPKGYIERNHDIVDGSSRMIATPDSMTEERRSGTWATIRYARLKKVPLYIVFPNGTVSFEEWGDIS